MDTKPSVHDALGHIQRALRVPKDKKNDFGGYDYRNAEGILAAVKPYLGDAIITLTDEIVEVAGRVYVGATAAIWCNGDFIDTTAYAREPLTAKGKDESMLTGSASSYARKYALQGLLAIDDGTFDPDSENPREGRANAIIAATGEIGEAGTVDHLRDVCAKYKAEATSHGWANDLLAMFKKRQAEIIASSDADAGEGPPPSNSDGTSDEAPTTCEKCGRPVDPMVGCDVCNAVKEAS